MTTTVRSVDVRLNAHVDSYIAKMKLAGQATDQAFSRSQVGLKSTNEQLAKNEERLSQTTKKTREYSLETAIADERTARLRKSLRDQARASLDAADGLTATHVATRQVGDSSVRAGAQIDRFSGRLKLVAQAGAVFGPGLIPLGAAGLPALVGMTAQVGALVSALGVGVLAFNGMGDALKSVNDYQLEPTAENLQAMRIEMEKLGPDGAHFVRFVDDLSSELSTLKMAARGGLLPGVEEGITALMPMLPRVRTIISDIAGAMGGLAADAGADLADPEWRDFFDYLESDAGPLLTDFGLTLGNFAQGFANVLVGFGPLTSDFSDGLRGMSEAFADWSANLDSNDSFQSFLDYLADAGPMALDFLGSLVEALTALLRAAAPVGDVVLPTLTAMLDVIGALASTDMGTMFFAAAAGLSVYSRAAGLVAAANTRMAASSLLSWRQTKALGAGIGIAALSMTDLDDKAGLSNTAMLALAGSIAGPWGAAAGAAVGVTMDLAAANDDLASAVEAANDAMAAGADDAQIRQQMEAVRKEISATEDVLGGDGFFSMNKPKQMLTGLNEVLGIFGPTTEDAASALFVLEGQLGTTDAVTEQLAAAVGMTADQFRVATGNAQAFTGALASMAGWLDKRAAFREYREELKSFGNALKDGFQPKNAEGLDRVASSIIKVASQIKNVDKRADFMAGARESLLQFAETGPKAERAVGKVIAEFVRLGLMDPVVDVDADTKSADGKLNRTGRNARDLQGLRVSPRVDADTRAANNKLSSSMRLARELAGLPVRPKIDVNNGQANSAIADTARRLAGVRDKTVTITVRQQRVIDNIMGDDGPRADRPRKPSADGGSVPKTGMPYADRHPYLLADGEEVISNRYGQADKNRAALKAANAGARLTVIGGLADGGTARSGPPRRRPRLDFDIGDDVSELRAALRDLRGDLKKSGRDWTASMDRQAARLVKLTRGYERHTQDLKNMREASKSFRDEVGGTFRNDVFGNGLEGLRVGLEADANDADAMERALRAAASKGLDGALADALAASGDLNTAQQLAGLSRSEIARYERLFRERDTQTGQLGAYAAQQKYGEGIREHTRWLARNEGAIRDLTRVLSGLPRNVELGLRRGSGDRDLQTRLRVRAGVR
ncbi:hypothetical protein [Nocardioides lijunqiniae]|uniref:hypothetical protein n=1 Tax=Nocardioides lijunqiniae TaxID=2760832 RepID=UPI0018778D0A|nr:hypothetical protein [Nocardioides lijunqiniae]